MNVLQSMDMNHFVVIAPSVLIAMYIIITLQKKLSNGENVHRGLIIPVICFVIATILAFKPLFTIDSAETGSLVGTALRVWMTFNIPTLALLFPYLIGLKNRKERLLMEEVLRAAQEDPENVPAAADVQAECNTDGE